MIVRSDPQGLTEGERNKCGEKVQARSCSMSGSPKACNWAPRGYAYSDEVSVPRVQRARCVLDAGIGLGQK